MRFIFSLLFFIICFTIGTPIALANETDANRPVITIINPLRGKEWHGKNDLLASLKAQWQVTKEVGVNATWLWQYTALEDDSMIAFAKDHMPNQEFGLWFEIDRNATQKAGVRYKGQGPSHFSDGLFLSSYDVNERNRLIDASFELFKKKFGFYPKTVGSWWIGADSLTYMQKKYGIVAAMKAAEQFDMDVYSIWGSPWSIPYVASTNNQSIPASAEDNSGVVIMQWAARDPTDGYWDARYSIQDYNLLQYDKSYVDYLLTYFLQKPLDNIVLGVENGGNKTTFEAMYKEHVTRAKNLERNGKVDVLVASDFAEKFLAQDTTFSNKSNNHFFITTAFKSKDQSFWYINENFRLGIQKTNGEIALVDLQDYTKKVHEDFAVLPNTQGHLKVSTPFIIDAMQMPSSKNFITKSNEQLRIIEKGHQVTLFSGERKIATVDPSSVQIFSDTLGTKLFTFTEKAATVNIFGLLLGIFLLYFLVIYAHKNNIKESLMLFLPLFIPLFLAYPFLAHGILGDITFFFDKKMLFLLNLAPLFSFLSVTQFLLTIQIVPLIALLFMHYVFVLRFSKMWSKFVYFIFFGLLIILYAHVPYFPLDRSTYGFVAVSVLFVAVVLIVLSIKIFKKKKLKKQLFLSFLGSMLILVLFVGVIVLSRSKIIITPFELAILQEIKDKRKDTIVISQMDYGVRPIYRSVKPLFYENYSLAEKLTQTKWEEVFRPENDVAKLDNIDNKLIVIPRFLGGDFSGDEMKINNVRKIFDNRQIAIYEKK